jgi:5-formyltetrahydrofolate cyclo-ligase
VLSKPELRRELKIRLASLPPGSCAQEGSRAAAVLAGHSLWGKYGALLLFLSIKNEIDTGPLLEAALGAGKKVFAPRIAGENLAFYRVFSPAGPWREGPFGIREPAVPDTGPAVPGTVPGNTGPAALAPAPLSPADFPALIIVPGLGFDRRGNRLGRGRGYYDRFLTALDRRGLPFTVAGFCLEAQLLPEIPADPRDRNMDLICTAAGMKYPGV